MPRYAMKFSKEGMMKYISHLDMMRLFRRTFKRSGMSLVYSKGYNPHPKMSFAQPLSLGYTSIGEWMDFETQKSWKPKEILNKLQPLMPHGVTLLQCREEKETKTLAARCTAAEYLIRIPLEKPVQISSDCAADFLAQETIMVPKKQKKNKKWKDVNIREKIQSLELHQEGNNLFLSTVLDAGSQSNLSPELLIQAWMSFFGLPLHRETIEILRKKIIL